jgi:hypothetical protein
MIQGAGASVRPPFGRRPSKDGDNLLLNLFSIGFFEESSFVADGWRPGWTMCHRAAKEKMRLRW